MAVTFNFILLAKRNIQYKVAKMAQKLKHNIIIIKNRILYY